MYHTLLLSKQPKLITAIFKHKLCDKIKQQKKGSALSSVIAVPKRECPAVTWGAGQTTDGPLEFMALKV